MHSGRTAILKKRKHKHTQTANLQKKKRKKNDIKNFKYTSKNKIFWGAKVEVMDLADITERTDGSLNYRTEVNQQNMKRTDLQTRFSEILLFIIFRWKNQLSV